MHRINMYCRESGIQKAIEAENELGLPYRSGPDLCGRSGTGFQPVDDEMGQGTEVRVTGWYSSMALRLIAP